MAGNEAVTGHQGGGLAGLAEFLDRFPLPLVLVIAGWALRFLLPGGALMPTERF